MSFETGNVRGGLMNVTTQPITDHKQEKDKMKQNNSKKLTFLHTQFSQDQIQTCLSFTTLDYALFKA